ncbi:phage tail protein [Paenibacillus sp. FSL H7-0326]|uniref:major tail protein n=1 Tax=Paenibacillus sp. FSL H7-0326 TaxID=1921144 RepID=UPI00096F0DB5|nr:major tail protein [Paenibacillus sp. FSL H7-0326]OMC71087.1 phage tail protein [Paenibacillus sp. FSL H7-0326]
MPNKVVFGFRNVHVAFMDAEATEQPAWETPIPLPGAVRFTPEVVGETTPFYADDTTYYAVDTNNGYTAELEIALLPDDLKIRMLGWKRDTNGMIVEVADGVGEQFALLGQVAGDQRNRRFVYYKCSATRPAKELTTKGESTEVNTDVVNLTISPIEIDDEMIVKGDIELNDTNATVFNSFFNSVYLPTFSTTPEGA